MIELSAPREMSIPADTAELLTLVDSAIAEFNKLRPFDADTEARIKMAFLPDRVTASLNMEGIVATRRQTLAVLDAMTISENASKTEKEILNALEADELTFETAQSEKQLSERFIREINSLIERNIGEAPGAYRLRDLRISQAAFIPPFYQDVPSYMEEMVSIYNESGANHALQRAVWLHARFTHIHPFLDGNGRTGRLLQDYCLLSSGLFPTGIPSSKRDDYYDALASADQNDWAPLIQIVGLRELEVIAKASAVAQERNERKKWVGALAKRASEKKKGALYKQYLVWLHKMNALRASFELAATEFNKASDLIQIRHENYDIADFQTWKEICDRGYGTRTWFFSQTFEVENQKLFKYAFYLRRHRPSGSDCFEPNQNMVALYLTGGKYDEKYEFNGRFADKDIRLREVLLHMEEMFQYLGTGSLEPKGRVRYEKTLCEQVDDINQIVQSFTEDVLINKVGI
ncbi:MAG: Fic family protein [Acetobacter sp.]|nr:Fic family protein [Acetobacter sp.]MCH4060727.1 Fic family protein [Acetobacter sp.]MCH4087667.1 Fic family protein [Acetobacter sp.]MCI1294410.1 Fic family protein [Acetobacter sp.]MCI1321060.1 Fic family protein [Acetobacter sp.]